QQQLFSLSQYPDLPILVDSSNADLGSLEVSIQSLTENNIAYIGIDVNDDSGSSVFSDVNDVMVESQFLVNNSVETDFSQLNPVAPGNYILPFVTEYLSTNWFYANPSDVLTVTLRATDEAGNHSSYSYDFSIFSLFPVIHFNTLFNSSDIDGFRYINNLISGAAGDCSTDSTGYCRISLRSGSGIIYLTITDGR